jgi:hypothetical protein
MTGIISLPWNKLPFRLLYKSLFHFVIAHNLCRWHIIDRNGDCFRFEMECWTKPASILLMQELELNSQGESPIGRLSAGTHTAMNPSPAIFRKIIPSSRVLMWMVWYTTFITVFNYVEISWKVVVLVVVIRIVVNTVIMLMIIIHSVLLSECLNPAIAVTRKRLKYLTN